MNFCNYQRSRLFTYLCPGCLRFSIFIFSKTAGLIETELHVEPLWNGGMKVCSWDLGQMIKIFAIPIYDKKKQPLNIFSSGLERLKTLKRGTRDSHPTRFIQMVTIG